MPESGLSESSDGRLHGLLRLIALFKKWSTASVIWKKMIYALKSVNHFSKFT